MANTKIKYLRQLKHALRWRLPLSESKETLADYEGFFDEGILAGRSEAELCAQFGQPKETAHDLSRDAGFSGKPLGLLAVALFALSLPLTNIVIPVLGFHFGQAFLGHIHFHYPEIAWFAAPLVLLLWFFWRKIPCAPLPEPEKRKPFRLCALALLIWLVSLVLAFLFSSRLDSAFSHGSITELGWILANLLWTAQIVLAAILLRSLLLAWGKSLWYLVPAACCLGLLSGIGRFVDDARNPSIFQLFGGLLMAAACAALTAWLILHGTAVETRLRETMRSGGEGHGRWRLFLLMFWPFLSVCLAGGAGPQFDWSYVQPLFAAPLLLPLLCLLLRGVPKGQPLSRKQWGEAAVLFAVPAIFPFALSALILYVFHMGTLQWQMVIDLYMVFRLLTAFVMLTALMKCWLCSAAFLVPAAHCVCVLTTMANCWQLLCNLDLSHGGTLTFSMLASSFAAPYALGWLGAGLAFLIRIGWNHHGRAA